MKPGVLWDGQRITAPGIYSGIHLDHYHGDLCDGHSVSHSGLEKVFKKSPKHYFDKWYGNPDREEDKPTENMILGRAAHHLFLGERDFQKYYIRRPALAPDGTDRKWNGNNLACIKWLEVQAAKGLIVFTEDQAEKLTRMSRALSAEPMVKPGGILNGHIEQSFIWQDGETGLWMKGRPDVVPNDSGDFVDLKVIADISNDGIQRAIDSFGYHRQAALVLEGASKLLDIPLVFRDSYTGPGLSWTLVFVEATRPHAVEIIGIKANELQNGMRDNLWARRLLKRCIDTGEWPGPSGHQADAREIERKPWRQEDDAHRSRVIERMLAIQLGAEQ